MTSESFKVMTLTCRRIFRKIAKTCPFALIEKGTPIIVILTNNDTQTYMESIIEEIKSRGAYVITITDIIDHDFSDLIFQIPLPGSLTSLHQ